MLRNFRQVFKGNQGVTGGLMIVLSVGMLAYLGSAFTGSRADAPESTVARVYGHEILRRDVDAQISEMVRRMGKQADPQAMLPYLQARAMSQLINQKLLEELAERHSILATQEEIRTALENQLRQYAVFLGEGQRLRPAEEINQMLRENGLSLKQWEQEIRLHVLTSKLMEAAASRIPVDEAWLQVENRVRNEKIAFESVTVEPKGSEIQDPGDGALSVFLKAAGARFQQGPRRVLQYVAVDRASLGAALNVDEATLKAAYDSKRSEYTELKASHILFKAENEVQFQEATKKAAALRIKLKGGADFNKAALDLSEDPSAKSNRGDLGWFKSGAMVKPFEDAAMGLKSGEISQPVRSPFGIHLIRLEGRKDRTFAEAKDELRQKLTEDRFAFKAKEKLESLRKRAGDRGDLGPAARVAGLKVQVSTPFCDEADALVSGLAGSASMAREAFTLRVGNVSKVVRVGDQFVVYRVQEERPSAIPPLLEIRGKVLSAWQKEEARTRLSAKAKAAVQANNLAALGTVSQENGTLASLGNLGQSPAIRKALLAAPVGKLTPVLWTPEGKLWVARIKSRTAAPALNFEGRRALVRELQSAGAQPLLGAELRDLEVRGNARPGFSSLWGYLGGIWISRDASLGKTANPVEAD